MLAARERSRDADRRRNGEEEVAKTARCAKIRHGHGFPEPRRAADRCDAAGERTCDLILVGLALNDKVIQLPWFGPPPLDLAPFPWELLRLPVELATDQAVVVDVTQPSQRTGDARPDSSRN